MTYSTASDDIMLLGQTFLRKFKSWSIDNGKAGFWFWNRRTMFDFEFVRAGLTPGRAIVPLG